MKQQLLRFFNHQIVKENKSFLLFIVLMLFFRTTLADWNVVPTGSMKPTIVEGDRILVNKIAYDLRIPFTNISLLNRAEPMRGDIVVFNSKASGKRLVKRVVGLPGERVAMRDNVLFINGQQVEYRYIKSNQLMVDKTEDLLGIKHAVRTHAYGSNLSSFASVMIPERYYLLLGDNRDNSADSRVIGLVPRHEIIGRSKQVVMSLNYDHYWLPRPERFFRTL